jgi:hypothetical protein
MHQWPAGHHERVLTDKNLFVRKLRAVFPPLSMGQRPLQDAMAEA